MTKGTSKLREIVQRVKGDTEVFIGTEKMLEEDYSTPQNRLMFHRGVIIVGVLFSISYK